jgi:hypothetical protein
MVEELIKMEDLICKSIKEKKLLEINYKEEFERIIEPHIYGLDKYGRKLSAYQISGFSLSGDVPNWKLFKVDLISHMVQLDRQFQLRSDYNPDYKLIPGVICKI